MEFLSIVFAIVLGNGLTLLLIALVAVNILLFRGYLWTILWAVVIGQALQSAKERVLECLATLSRRETENGKPDKSMLLVLWEDIRREMTRRHEKQHLFAVLLEFLLDNGISLFALVGFVSLVSHLVPFWLIVLCAVAVVAPMLGFLYLVDRNIFAYRRVVNDETLASLFVIGVFFSSVSFIILFLGTESLLEGITAWNAGSAWVQGMLEDEGNKAEWARQISRANAFARESFTGLEQAYGDAVWWPVVNRTVNHYLVHGTLAIDPKGFVGGLFPQAALLSGQGGGIGGGIGGVGGLEGELDDSCVADGGTSYSVEGILTSLRGQLSGLNVSLDKAYEYATYAGWSGKLVAGMSLEIVQLLSTVAGFLLGLGFKMVLFSTALFYVTSCGDLLERAVADLLPVPVSQKADVVLRLRRGIEGVFFLPCKIACFHGIVTLCWFGALEIEFPFFATFLTVVLSVIPLVPAYYAAAPWMLVRLFTKDWLTGLLLFLVHYFTLAQIDNLLCAIAAPSANPYFTGLSIFLGFAVFGTQGVVLGPLIISFGMLIYSSLGYLESSSVAAPPPFSPTMPLPVRSSTTAATATAAAAPALAEPATAPATPTGGYGGSGFKRSASKSWLADSPFALHTAEQRGLVMERGAKWVTSPEREATHHRRGSSVGASPERARDGDGAGGSRSAVVSRRKSRVRARGSAARQGDEAWRAESALLADWTAAREQKRKNAPRAEVRRRNQRGSGSDDDDEASVPELRSPPAALSFSSPASASVAAAGAAAAPGGSLEANDSGQAMRHHPAAKSRSADAQQQQGQVFVLQQRPHSVGGPSVITSSPPSSLTEVLLQRVGNVLWKDGRGALAAPLHAEESNRRRSDGDGRWGSVVGGETVRVKLYLKRQQDFASRNADSGARSALQQGPGWRCDVRRDAPWHAFLREAADLLRVEGVEAVYGADGSLLCSVKYFDEGEALQVVVPEGGLSRGGQYKD